MKKDGEVPLPDTPETGADPYCEVEPAQPTSRFKVEA